MNFIKKNLGWLILGTVGFCFMLTLCDPPKVDKPAIKKENKAAAKVIKAEEKKRRGWKADSLELVRVADSTRISNTQLKDLIKQNRNNEKRPNPVYHTDTEYDGFFSNRYRKKGLVR